VQELFTKLVFRISLAAWSTIKPDIVTLLPANLAELLSNVHPVIISFIQVACENTSPMESIMEITPLDRAELP
jgi:hypothetical protein